MLHRKPRLCLTSKQSESGKQFPLQQVTYRGKVADATPVYPYGYYANATVGTLGVMLNDESDNKIFMPITSTIRPVLKDGEVAIYHPPTDAIILFDEGGDINIDSGNDASANVNINCAKANITGTQKVVISTPLCKITGDLQVGGDSEFIGGMINDGKDVSATHEHSQGVDSDGNTQKNIVGVL